MPGFFTLRAENKKLIVLDQTLLPEKEVYISYTDYRDIIAAIKRLEIRGAPAIGIAAACRRAYYNIPPFGVKSAVRP